jgi:hypothetical protein
MALTSAMTSSWGFNRLATGTFLTVSSTWNLAMRLVFGILALAWLTLSASGSALTTAMTVPALVVAAALVVLLTLALVKPRAACAVSAWAGALADRVRPQPSAEAMDRRHRWALGMLRLSGQVRRIVRRSWPRMTTGMAGYAILLSALLWVCLIAVGASSPAPAAVICAVAVERMVTAVPITPGGAGVAEVALVAVLHAGGVDPVQAVAAALVFRAFTYGMEIPLGAGVALAWLARRRWPVRRGAVA